MSKNKFEVGMTEKRVLSFSSIFVFFKENNKELKLGEDSYTNGYVSKVTFDAKVQPAVLMGEVGDNSEDNSYSVKISLNAKNGILGAECSCLRGLPICQHMAAVCIFAYDNNKITDKPRSRKTPKQNEEDEDEQDVKTIDQLYPPKKPGYSALGRQLTQDEINKFVSSLPPCGFTWLLQPDTSEVQHSGFETSSDLNEALISVKEEDM